MEKKKNPLHNYLKYTGLGFEFLACILLFVGLGYGLDQWVGTRLPLFMLFLSLIGCGLAIYLLVKRLTKP
ncbi:MAG: AtpZ/AtpI family protein [Bacteroidota bacterium]